MLKLAVPLTAVALAASAEAQIRPVSRTSTLSSYYLEWDDSGGRLQQWGDTFTAWVSDDRAFPYTEERLQLSQNQIHVAADVWGTGWYSQMSRHGWEYAGSYTGVFVFDLATAGSYDLSGDLRAAQGSTSVSFYDDTRGVELFSAASQSFSTINMDQQGGLLAGRYRLVVSAVGHPIQPLGPGDAHPTVNLTVVPSPTPLAVLALIALPRRRRAPR